MNEASLHKIYAACGADALFLEQDFLRRYVTGFYSTDGYVVYDGSECTFVADARYFEAAERALRGSFVRVREGGRREARSDETCWPALCENDDAAEVLVRYSPENWGTAEIDKRL